MLMKLNTEYCTALNKCLIVFFCVCSLTIREKKKKLNSLSKQQGFYRFHLRVSKPLIFITISTDRFDTFFYSEILLSLCRATRRNKSVAERCTLK